MKSLAGFSKYPTSLPVLADDVLEFHAARLLLLIKLCGRNNAINGLTKLAKLDFFVRYPKFFAVACKHLNVDVPETDDTIESHMIRFHYGPWDQKYYHVLAYLESKGLITIEVTGKAYVISLSQSGQDVSRVLSEQDAFGRLVSQMTQVSEVLGRKKGTELKNLVYKLFHEEVAKLTLKEVIE